jgi:WD40 repeat protein
MQILKGHLAIKPVRSLAFAPDGKHLASSARDYKTFLWDLSTGKHQVIDSWDSYFVAFSPDGSRLVTGRGHGFSVWSAETGELRTVTPDDYGGSLRVAVSPDGRLVAAVGSSVRLWELATLEMLPPWEGNRWATRCLAFSPDGKTLACGHSIPRTAQGGSKATAITLWDVAKGQPRAHLHGPGAVADSMAYSPDGRLLAACCGTGLWVWDVSTGEVRLSHKIDKQFFKDVAFSPDGRFLAFARNDRTVRLWETAGWREAAAYDFAIGPMISIAFAPDGMRAAGGSGKGKIVVWDVDV